MMNANVISNYLRLKPSLFILPVLLLITIVLLLYGQGALNVNGYTQIQKDSFLSINYSLAQYPNLQLNLTQLGDGLIILSFLTILILYAPKVWEAIISALLVSVLFSSSLKKIFAVPRPAAVFDNENFFIIGKRLAGFNSTPSGHSITTFTVLTVLLFAFMPKKLTHQIIWVSLVIIMGLIFTFTRVGVGAHYPIDVISGSIIGYISGVAGIFISRKYKIWAWVGNRKSYPFFILLFLVCCVILINKITNENLTIYYLSFVSIAFSLYKIIAVYVKK